MCLFCCLELVFRFTKTYTLPLPILIRPEFMWDSFNSNINGNISLYSDMCLIIGQIYPFYPVILMINYFSRLSLKFENYSYGNVTKLKWIPNGKVCSEAMALGPPINWPCPAWEDVGVCVGSHTRTDIFLHMGTIMFVPNGIF